MTTVIAIKMKKKIITNCYDVSFSLYSQQKELSHTHKEKSSITDIIVEKLYLNYVYVFKEEEKMK